jgi:hypothetical protein
MEIKIDTKSLILGALVAGFMFVSISGKQPDERTVNNRYQVQISNNDSIVILDTQSGNYIFTAGAATHIKNRWIKGEFVNTFTTSKENRRE